MIHPRIFEDHGTPHYSDKKGATFSLVLQASCKLRKYFEGIIDRWAEV